MHEVCLCLASFFHAFHLVRRPIKKIERHFAGGLAPTATRFIVVAEGNRLFSRASLRQKVGALEPFLLPNREYFK